MDTTKKGDDLEDKIYELFRNDISNGHFWAKTECCKIYQKKGYFSKDREKNIIFDISIEISLPGEKSYSSLVLIECKHYNKKVPVGDVESFLMKAHQVSGGNIKAIVASNNSFQEGAFNFSRTKGIGLLRYYDRSNLEWVLHRSPSSIVSSSFSLNELSGAYDGLHKIDYESKYFDFFGCVNNDYTTSLKLFFSSLLKQGQENKYIKALEFIETTPKNEDCTVKYLSETEIEEICKKLHTKIEYSYGAVPLDKICAFLSNEHDLKVIETSDLPKGVLGKISFSPLVINILKDHENEARRRFTLAHELGHFLLGHSKYMSAEMCVESSLDLEKVNDLGIKDIMRMEWQANQFASYLLLPLCEFTKTFNSIALRNGLSNRGFGVLYLDNQKCNQDAYFNVTSPLMKRYNVSRKVIKIRLKKLGYIKEVSFQKPNKAFSVGNFPQNFAEMRRYKAKK
ncbi:MAG: ImmA/IrrE family metallo-endopeptidase [Methyloprofundus sp.]|nr:ImmA/IrrE family metallo-endopeptidase [Methyloprofundus sp.]